MEICERENHEEAISDYAQLRLGGFQIKKGLQYENFLLYAYVRVWIVGSNMEC